MKFQDIFLDVETTSLIRFGRIPDILEICLLIDQETFFLKRVYSRKKIHPTAYRLHGIQSKDVKHEKKFIELWPEILEWLNFHKNGQDATPKAETKFFQ